MITNVGSHLYWQYELISVIVEQFIELPTWFV